MTHNEKALAALEATITELGLPEPTSAYLYAPAPTYLTASAVYSVSTAALPGIGWTTNRDGIPLHKVERDGVQITIQARSEEAAA